MRQGNKYTQNVGKVKGKKNGVMVMDVVGVVWVGLKHGWLYDVSPWDSSF